MIETDREIKAFVELRVRMELGGWIFADPVDRNGVTYVIAKINGVCQLVGSYRTVLANRVRYATKVYALRQNAENLQKRVDFYLHG